MAVPRHEKCRRAMEKAQRMELEVLDELGHIRERTTGRVRPLPNGARELVFDTDVTLLPGESVRWTETWEVTL